MTTSPQPDRVTAIYDALDAFQREHRIGGGLGHAQIRALLAEHLDRALPAAVPAVAPATDQTALVSRIAELEAEVEQLTNASRLFLNQRQEMAEERYAWQERGDRAEARVRELEAGQAALSDAERQFLTFALDLAFDRMVSDDGFTAEDEAALEKLRRMAAEAGPDVVAQQPKETRP